MKGGTPQASKLGYQMDNLSRNTRRTANITQIESGDHDDKPSMGNSGVQVGRKGIVMTTETDVTWHEDSLNPAKNGTSMESLV